MVAPHPALRFIRRSCANRQSLLRLARSDTPRRRKRNRQIASARAIPCVAQTARTPQAKFSSWPCNGAAASPARPHFGCRRQHNHRNNLTVVGLNGFAVGGDHRRVQAVVYVIPGHGRPFHLGQLAPYRCHGRSPPDYGNSTPDQTLAVQCHLRTHAPQQAAHTDCQSATRPAACAAYRLSSGRQRRKTKRVTLNTEEMT